MTDTSVSTGEQFTARVKDTKTIASVVNRACRRAVAEQGRAGLPAVVWRNGQVTRLQPSEAAKLFPADKSNWISAICGSFKDDPEFDEIVRLGKETRDAEQPPDN